MGYRKGRSLLPDDMLLLVLVDTRVCSCIPKNLPSGHRTDVRTDTEVSNERLLRGLKILEN